MTDPIVPSIDNINDLKNFINNYSQSSIIDKKQKGEVFTPNTITNNMLNELSNEYQKEYNKNIFQNPNLKWYDNSSGIGNIMICIYCKLYDGLQQIIPNNDKRKKHIIEKMLYASELNKKNVDIYKKIFDPNNNYKLNIYNGDSLLFDFGKLWNVNNFDIIIGNPPYQKQNKKNNSARGGTNNNLYIDFIQHSINTLANNGYLVYIHPQNWRKIQSNIFNELKQKTLLHISLNYGGNYFDGVSVKTDFYVLKNAPYLNTTTTTNIKCYNKKSQLLFSSQCNIDNNVHFIPSLYSNEIKNIINKINTIGVSRICVSTSDCHKVRNHVQKGENAIFKYPLYNTSGNPFGLFSSKEHKDQTKHKVLMSSSGKLSPFYDNGIYGTTQDSMYFLVNDENEGKFMVGILNTKLYVFLINICHWGNFRNEPLLLSYLKYPLWNNLNNIQNMNDFVFKYYDLSVDEIKVIDEYYNCVF